jgi:fumarate hydratase class I
VIEALSRKCIHRIQHFFRPAHLAQLSNILADPEASQNDQFVALELLKNANVSAGGVFPSCQDTGTAVCFAKRGHMVFTDERDEHWISEGVLRAYQEGNLRYSQVSPIDMFQEINTKNNLPAQVDIFATPGNTYKFLFIAKGGGSANKTRLIQESRSLLNEEDFSRFVTEILLELGTAACPPYHLAICIGGLSPEQNLKTVKLASCKYYDNLPNTGSVNGRAFRDFSWEQRILDMSRQLGIGAQFGGKYFLHDVRVIRLPRHSASLPVSVGLSCSADRQMLAKITPQGVFLEQLEEEPSKYFPSIVPKADAASATDVVPVDLNRPMEETIAQLTQYPVKTRLSLTGTMIVARDMAHARISQRLKRTGKLEDYFINYPVYYAGPAKTPAGQPTGSFGPTTSGRMDAYVDEFQRHGGSRLMIGKGNRSPVVRKSCKKHGGFYLGSIGGAAAALSSKSIKSVEVLDMEELGMEAVWKITVEDFPAFIIVDDKGNDFFKNFSIDAVEINDNVVSILNEFPELFAMIDSSKNSRIEAEEIVAALGFKMEEAEQLIDKYDMAKIGALDIDQFLVAYSENQTLKARVDEMYSNKNKKLVDEYDDD